MWLPTWGAASPGEGLAGTQLSQALPAMSRGGLQVGSRRGCRASQGVTAGVDPGTPSDELSPGGSSSWRSPPSRCCLPAVLWRSCTGTHAAGPQTGALLGRLSPACCSSPEWQGPP